MLYIFRLCRYKNMLNGCPNRRPLGGEIGVGAPRPTVFSDRHELQAVDLAISALPYNADFCSDTLSDLRFLI